MELSVHFGIHKDMENILVATFRLCRLFHTFVHILFSWQNGGNVTIRRSPK